MAKASSSKKIARLAASGSRKRVRNQQGLLFPVSIAIVVALGIHFGGRWLIDTIIALHS